MFKILKRLLIIFQTLIIIFQCTTVFCNELYLSQEYWEKYETNNFSKIVSVSNEEYKINYKYGYDKKYGVCSYIKIISTGYNTDVSSLNPKVSYCIDDNYGIFTADGSFENQNGNQLVDYNSNFYDDKGARFLISNLKYESTSINSKITIYLEIGEIRFLLIDNEILKNVEMEEISKASTTQNSDTTINIKNDMKANDVKTTSSKYSNNKNLSNKNNKNNKVNNEYKKYYNNSSVNSNNNITNDYETTIKIIEDKPTNKSNTTKLSISSNVIIALGSIICAIGIIVIIIAIIKNNKNNKN